MAKLTKLERFFRDGAKLIAERPDLTREVLICAYARGIGNAMRAVGHWPDRSKRKVESKTRC